MPGPVFVTEPKASSNTGETFVTTRSRSRRPPEAHNDRDAMDILNNYSLTWSAQTGAALRVPSQARITIPPNLAPPTETAAFFELVVANNGASDICIFSTVTRPPRVP